jgi:hypothetical protein
VIPGHRVNAQNDPESDNAADNPTDETAIVSVPGSHQSPPSLKRFINLISATTFRCNRDFKEIYG